MKILKKADVSNWSFVYVCDKCDSELEVEKEDLIYQHYAGDMRESGYDTYRAKCPVCNQLFDVPENKIPKLIKIETQSRWKNPHR